VAETGAQEIHPYDDPRVIAGQGTALLELVEDAGPLDAVITPVGGGGLLSGTAIAAAGLAAGDATGPRSAAMAVYAGEPAGADDAARSLAAGRLIPSTDPQTICDGLLTSLSPRTFGAITAHVTAILTVDDAAVRHAMRLVFERMKLVIEPSAAVPLAAVLAHRERIAGRRIGIILSGGNLDLARWRWRPLAARPHRRDLVSQEVPRSCSVAARTAPACAAGGGDCSPRCAARRRG